jgi:hypothetical protein
MVGKQFSDLFFHCYQFLSFLYLYYNIGLSICQVFFYFF